MRDANPLVSVGLPVRNGADRIERVVASVLNQDHENLELVICDNASTDDTEEACRRLAAQDSRIAYHRHPVNVGLLNNFVTALWRANGTFFRWLGDDDWLDARYVSRCVETFAEDDRLVLVTTQMAYTDPDGVTRTARYEGTAFGSDDPIIRLAEMLRLQNESYLLIDPLYGLARRESVVRIERRNMLNEDQVFAAKLALAGPWGHVPEVLAGRTRDYDPAAAVARRLDVPRWQAHFPTALQCRELLRLLDTHDLDQDQRKEAKRAVARLFLRRQAKRGARRSRKLLRIPLELATSMPMRSSLPRPAHQTTADAGHINSRIDE